MLGVAERDHKAQRGVVFIFLSEYKENSKVIEIVREHNSFYTHQQIEIKNGMLFMRLKKRALDNIHA